MAFTYKRQAEQWKRQRHRRECDDKCDSRFGAEPPRHATILLQDHPNLASCSRPHSRNRSLVGLGPFHRAMYSRPGDSTSPPGFASLSCARCSPSHTVHRAWGCCLTQMGWHTYGAAETWALTRTRRGGGSTLSHKLHALPRPHPAQWVKLRVNQQWAALWARTVGADQRDGAAACTPGSHGRGNNGE